MTADDDDTSGASRQEPDEAAQYIQSLFRQPDQPHLIDPDRDRFLSLIISNLASLDSEETTWLAKATEFAGFIQTVRLFHNFEARRFVGDKHRYTPLLTTLDDMQQTIDTVKRRLTIAAIQSKALTRRDAAHALNVHENTVARWVKEADENSIQTVFSDILGRELGRILKMSYDEKQNIHAQVTKALQESRVTKTPAVNAVLEYLRGESYDTTRETGNNEPPKRHG